MAITRSRSRPVTQRAVISATSSAFLSSLSKPTTTALDALKSDAVPVTPSPTKSKKRKQSPSPPAPPPSRTLLPTPSVKSVWTRSIVTAINPNQPYLDLEVPPEELRPSATLTTGQSFVWKVVVDDEADTHSQTKSAWGTHDATEWIGILRISQQHSAVVAIQETPTTTLYRPLTSTLTSDMDWKQVLRDYFQLDHSLLPLYNEWSQADPRLAAIAKCIPGVRILNQDPWECLVSFICSSNNNIPRITKMVNAMRQEFGKPLLTEQENGTPETLYSFPSLEELSKATDVDLREKCGLGYRAKYILETIQILQEKGGESYLYELKQMTDPLEVQTRLCEFSGVGRKVADCVALFSLRQENAIPVDVHVWNIARRDYDPHHQLAQIKSLTPTTYQQVGDVFRQRFPSKAGWAHSLLFVAELPSFRPVLPEDIVKEMDGFQREEKQRKQETRDARKKKKNLDSTSDETS